MQTFYGNTMRGLRQLYGSTAPYFNPLLLRPDVKFDISKTELLYKDTKGNGNSSLSGDPVGMAIEDSFTLGPELATNSNRTIANPGDWNIDDTNGIYERTGGDSWSEIWWEVSADKTYRVSFTVESTVNSARLIRRTAVGGSNELIAAVENGSKAMTYEIYGSLPRITFTGSGWRGKLSNISIREVVGKHLAVSSDSVRPLLRKRSKNLVKDSENMLGSSWVVESGLNVTASGTLGGSNAFKVEENETTYRQLRVLNDGWALSGKTVSIKVQKRNDATSTFGLRLQWAEVPSGDVKFCGASINVDTGQVVSGQWIQGRTAVGTIDFGDYWLLWFKFNPTTIGELQMLQIFPAHNNVNGVPGSDVTGYHVVSSLYIAEGDVDPNSYDATNADGSSMTGKNDIWFENDGVDDVGLQLKSDVPVKMVVLALQYRNGVETTASNYSTLFTDLAGQTTGTTDRCMLHQNNNYLYTGQTQWQVSISGGAFGTQMLPLPWSMVVIKKSDDSSFNLGSIGGKNIDLLHRTWRGRFAPIAAFDRILTADEINKLHKWAQDKLGVA